MTLAVTDAAVASLLASAEPGIRLQARVTLLDEAADAPELVALRSLVPGGAAVSALLCGQQADGGFGRHPYVKWTGAHWRLQALVDLGVPAGEPRCLAALETVLRWLYPRRVSAASLIAGRRRHCASQEGAALAVATRFGMGGDPRARTLAERLLEWQWPDGGWNCDVRPEATHSSFSETLWPARGLAHWAEVAGSAEAREGAERAAEFFLRHRLFRSERTGRVIDSAWMGLRYPPYWHYDVLQALRLIAELGRLADPRAVDALEHLERARGSDGVWRSRGRWWKRLGEGGGGEVVDWHGSGLEAEVVTLQALQVLRSAGRAVA